MTAQHLFCYQNQCNIYDVDAKLTKAPNWINDALLSFAMRYIETACFPKRKDLNFVSTYISYLLTYERDIEDITTAINANNIDQKRLLFFPINNNPYLTKVGGTHWSLLVYDDEEQKFYYFDSSRNMNLSAAKRLASQVCGFVNKDNYPLEEKEREKPSKSSSSSTSTSTKPTIITPTAFTALPPLSKIKASDFIICACPQQQNAYDSGMYVAAIAEYIATQLQEGNELPYHSKEANKTMAATITPEFVTEKRSELATRLKEAQKESEGRSSHRGR